ncbi:MAG: Mth938-like domain-containing protein [Gammaproteobacteria bacterium]
MELTREHNNPGEFNVINAYEAGQVHVNQVSYSCSMILTPTKLITDWGPRNVGELCIEHFKPIIEFNPEIVVLGTGDHHVFTDRQFMLHLLQYGAGLETMNTQAACRTYNILLGEGRKVVAALLLPG